MNALACNQQSNGTAVPLRLREVSGDYVQPAKGNGSGSSRTSIENLHFDGCPRNHSMPNSRCRSRCPQGITSTGMLFTNLARCLDSDHFQVIERNVPCSYGTMNIWSKAVASRAGLPKPCCPLFMDHCTRIRRDIGIMRPWKDWFQMC